MAYYEAICFWLSLVIYALSAGGYIYALVFRNEKVVPKLLVLIGTGLLVHTGAVAARYFAQGHFPWSTDYENGLMGGWFIIASTLFVAWRQKSLRVFAVATVPTTMLIMGYGVMRNPTLAPMAATLKSFWLAIHVFFAWLSFGAYALAMAAGVIYLLKERAAKQRGQAPAEPVPERFADLPPERLDDLMFKYLVFGFITNAIMIAAGSIWAKDLWGAYWSWDPVETWSLISWLMYGAAIHLRVTMGWRGTRFSWLMIGALLTVIINFFGVSILMKSSVHVFKMS
ncbi:cytochrome c biogenesis protein CcsA [Geomonas subterranea]|uniref:Cytochrome c biogenesis protein CcsA n=1 Tax=Geomonas subterranea TaxID=2847989 RepID=A0ABX8LER6_9BACT|nr:MULTISPECIES: cytochrome c biogenesis protein CcsA [Geomonas]QXE90543.1 cytochrome c biogenesis protein CcsA [Geomonas subterranea]QXM11379.1 cytochrome c biogenesis protein CcsA [Geomonas subterranea]